LTREGSWEICERVLALCWFVFVTGVSTSALLGRNDADTQRPGVCSF
jgi:hypothetical protein